MSPIWRGEATEPTSSALSDGASSLGGMREQLVGLAAHQGEGLVPKKERGYSAHSPDVGLVDHATTQVALASLPPDSSYIPSRLR